MLVSQAPMQGLVLVTPDDPIQHYAIGTLW